MYSEIISVHSYLKNNSSFGKYNFTRNPKMKNSYSVFMVSYSGTCCHVLSVYTGKLKENILQTARKLLTVWSGL